MNDSEIQTARVWMRSDGKLGLVFNLDGPPMFKPGHITRILSVCGGAALTDLGPAALSYGADAARMRILGITEAWDIREIVINAQGRSVLTARELLAHNIKGDATCETDAEKRWLEERIDHLMKEMRGDPLKAFALEADL